MKKRERSRDQSAKTEGDFFSLETQVYMKACEGFNTPRSLTCFLLTKYCEWEQLIGLPPAYHGSSTFVEDHGVTEMFKKNPRIPLYTSTYRRDSAVRTWYEAEALCKTTNIKIRKEFFAQHGAGIPNSFTEVIFGVRRELSHIMREVDFDFIADHVGFGPGATMSVRGRDVLPSRKLTVDNYTSTPSLIPLIAPLFPEGCSFSATGYNEFTTVPKSAKTDRSIAIEPHANILVQKGIGALIRKRLKQTGLTPNNQGENQKKALNAQKLGLATIDLSMASDTVAKELVRALFSDPWHWLLDLARTPCTKVGPNVHVLEKFSSMGNGYTWELETAIFCAIARYACKLTDSQRSLISVFGDDIVLPATAFSRCCELLETLGFRVNSKKSFWQGDFYESCGVDVFRGKNIRSYYFNGDFDDFETNCIRLANGIRRYSSRLGDSLYCDKRLYKAYRLCLDNCGRGRQTAIPDGFGDDGIVRNRSEVRDIKRRRHGLQGYRCLVLRRSPIASNRSCPNGLLWNYLFHVRVRSFGTDVLADGIHPKIKGESFVRFVSRNGLFLDNTQYSIPGFFRARRSGDSSNPDLDVCREPIRGKTSRPRYRVLHVFQWSDLGPWI